MPRFWPFRGSDRSALEVERDDDPVVFLTSAPNEPLAQLWTSLLEESGVRVLMKPGGAGIGGWGSAATLEHELYVLRSRLEEARRIIDDLERNEVT